MPHAPRAGRSPEPLEARSQLSWKPSRTLGFGLAVALATAGILTCDGGTEPPVNQPPRAVGTIPEQVVAVDSAVVVDVASYFADPDGDTLTYSAMSSSVANATVSVTGSMVTVTGVAAGSAMVTVTARDPEGLTAEQTFAVLVPNRVPVAVGTIDSVAVFVDSVAEVDVAEHFTDPDGDELAYQAVSSDTTLAAVEVLGSVVTVAGVAVGSVNVTVTAQDTAGLSAEQSFVATVPNRAPVALGTIADREVEVDSVVVLDVAEYFTDPDRQELEYSVAASDTTRVTVTVAGSEVTVAGMARGSATLTVTATDPGELTAEQSFIVTVPNRPPHAVGAIAEQDVYVGDTVAIEVAAHFSDPDGDTLTYTAASSDTALAAVSVSEGTVTVTGVAVGSVAVTVTATDTEGLAAEQGFAATVPNRAPEAVGTVAAREVHVGDSVTIDVAANFVELDGQELAYAVATSDAATVSVAVTGSAVTVRGVAVGMAMVTVTAQDPGELSVEQEFAVTVPNRAPGAVGTLSDLELEVDSVMTVEVAAHFAEPDGEELEYSVGSSDTTRVSVSISGTVVTMRGVRAGQATVTVVATDPGGLTAKQDFVVSVPNRPPVAVGAIADRVIQAGNIVEVNVADYFSDPDSDALWYYAASSDTTRVRATVLGRVATVRGVVAGTATVTVTARDPGGLSAVQSFLVTVPNRAPRAVGTIADTTIDRGSSTSFDASAYFTDPDGDDLSYIASSSSTATARVTVSGSSVTVTGRSLGTATITVTSHDPEGLTVAQSFDVTVKRPNRAPRAVGTVPNLTLAPDAEHTVDLDPYFTDPDGDELDYSATSSDRSVATVMVSDETVTVKGEAEGTATITVTATDPRGLAATQDFAVRVNPNQAPVAVRPIPDLTAVVGRRYSLPLDFVFTDPDGDPLSYTTATSDASVADPEVIDDTLFISAVGLGSATLSVTVTDPGGLSATETFHVMVSEGDFNILLGFTRAVTGAQRGWFSTAAAVWEAVLRPTELTDVTFPGPIYCGGVTVPAVPPVDDHLVIVNVDSVDGPGGTLAKALTCYVRVSDGTPIVSRTLVDEDDIDRLMRLNMLGVVAFHEFAHGLGFADWYWDRHGLLDTSNDPHFQGTRAIYAFDAAGGTAYTDNKVPISSPDHSHWRKNVFGNEGMTGSLNLAAHNPFSAITLQAMADAGYLVDVSLADDYQLPNTAPPDIAADQTGQILDLSNDVEYGPIMVVDPDGRVMRVIPPPPGSPVRSFGRHEVQVEIRAPETARLDDLTVVPPARGPVWRLVRPSARRPSR